MAKQKMYKHDAMLHMVWTIAIADTTPGEEHSYTSEENSYLDTIREVENINLSWSDFNAKRKELGWNREAIIDEACKAIRGCGKAWKMKCLGYMQLMAWVSQEDDLENNMSDKEWKLVLRAQRELGLTDDERNNSPNFCRNLIDEVSNTLVASGVSKSHVHFELFTTTLDNNINERDVMYREAAEVVVIAQQGSTSLLQRKLKLGYNRAGRIIDQLEAAGIVGPFEESKARGVSIPTLGALNQLLENE